MAKVDEFRAGYSNILHWSDTARPILSEFLERLYRDCQDFATERIREAATQVVARLEV
jgi:hypothetical protein